LNRRFTHRVKEYSRIGQPGRAATEVLNLGVLVLLAGDEGCREGRRTELV